MVWYLISFLHKLEKSAMILSYVNTQPGVQIEDDTFSQRCWRTYNSLQEKRRVFRINATGSKNLLVEDYVETDDWKT